jgi:hypothetical protein
MPRPPAQVDSHREVPMHEELAQERLRTGERLRVVVVEAPDDEHAGTVLSLLRHKGELRQWQFEEDFTGRAVGVRSRYYLGFLEGRAVANISVWETGPVGDLGHVFTAESHRRKGICQAVMATQMEDFRRRGGQLLVLGTRYDGPPYHIYQSFGFQSMVDGSGYMRYQQDPAFFARLFADAPVSTGAVAWADLGLVCGLMACPDGNWLRNARARAFGPVCYEGAFLDDLRETQRGHRQVQVARTSAGAAVGYAVLGPDPAWSGQCWLLDVFIHPAFVHCAPQVVGTLQWPAVPVHCHVDADSQLATAVIAAGFRLEARLSRCLSRGGEPVDVSVLTRS